ncbi:hypothetical protein ACVWYF_003619 [Hymenobacter sp. UYAg731]
MDEHANWHLGLDKNAGVDAKAADKFPCGDIEKAADELLTLLEKATR